MPIGKRKNRSNPEWIRRHLTDPYVRAATAHGYRSRAAYKLAEIDDREKFLRPGAVGVDLGAAPGSWTQVVTERLRDKTGSMRGRIVALDLLPIEPVSGVVVLLGDFRELEIEQALVAALAGAPVDVVLSDMAPNLSGIASADAARNADLAELAVEFSARHLRPNGVLLLKAFHGSGFSQLVEEMKTRFVKVATLKPKASRAESAETFLLARGLKTR